MENGALELFHHMDVVFQPSVASRFAATPMHTHTHTHKHTFTKLPNE